MLVDDRHEYQTISGAAKTAPQDMKVLQTQMVELLERLHIDPITLLRS